MSLRVRVALVSFALFLILFAALHFAASRVLLGSFDDLELSKAGESVDGIVKAFQVSQRLMQSVVRDWAAWDDTYAFMHNLNSGYKKTNVTPETFVNLKISVMLFVDPSGRVIYSQGFNPRNGKLIPAARSVIMKIAPGSPLLNRDGTSGLLVLPDGLMLMSSYPVLTSDRSGPSRGTLIFGRYINSPEHAEISGMLRAKASLAAHDGPLDGGADAKLLIDGMKADVHYESDDSMIARIVLKDVYRHETVMMSVPLNRSIHKQGITSLYVMDLALFIVGIAFSILSFLTTESMLIRRLKRLQKGLSDINVNGDLSERVDASGTDEVSQFAADVNVLLSNLQSYRSRNQAMLTALPDSVVLISADGVFLEHHMAEGHHFAAESAEVLGKTIEDVLPTEAAKLLRDALAATMESGNLESFEYERPSSEGGVRRYEVRVTQTGDGQFLGIIRDITEQHRAQDALKASEANYRAIFDSVNDAIVLADTEDFSILEVNDKAYQLLDYQPQRQQTLIEMLGRKRTSPHTSDNILRLLVEAAAGRPQVFEWPLRRDGEEIRWAEFHVKRAEIGGQYRLLAVVKDITDHKRAAASMYMQISAVNAASDQIMITSASGIIEFVNPAFERCTGYRYAEVIGCDWHMLCTPDSNAALDRLTEESLSSGQSWCGELSSKRKDGSISVEDTTITPIRSEMGAIENYISIKRDITERKQYEAELNQLAHHDVLTGLPNRLLFSDRLTQRLSDCRRNGDRLAVMFLDLDRFKLVNDSLGHNAGDMLLKQVSERLKLVLRDVDTVARMGGDEFTLIMPNVKNIDDASIPARRILEIMSDSFMISGHEMYLTTSIGISLFPQDGSDVESLVRAADTAMYHAKESGRNTFRFYTEALNVAAMERMTLENSLRKAIERNELLAHYQPRIHMQTGEILGAEALVRWMHPDLKLIPPAQFIPLAEETGQIVAIGEWMLKTACTQNKAWQDAGLPRISMGVNVSCRQFQLADIVGMVSRSLQETGLQPEYLDLELTESTLMMNPEHAVKVLGTLKDMGVHISLDDFGTGYSALSHLKHFPIDTVKIDRSFVQNITTQSDDSAIAQAIVAMAHSMNLTVVAEGVETLEQLNCLRAMGCDEMQGYFVGRPVPAEELEQILQTVSMMTPTGGAFGEGHKA